MTPCLCCQTSTASEAQLKVSKGRMETCGEWTPAQEWRHVEESPLFWMLRTETTGWGRVRILRHVQNPCWPKAGFWAGLSILWANVWRYFSVSSKPAGSHFTVPTCALPPQPQRWQSPRDGSCLWPEEEGRPRSGEGESEGESVGRGSSETLAHGNP